MCNEHILCSPQTYAVPVQVWHKSSCFLSYRVTVTPPRWKPLTLPPPPPPHLPQCSHPNPQCIPATQVRTVPPAQSPPTPTLSLPTSTRACTCRTRTPPTPPAPASARTYPLLTTRSIPNFRLCPPEGRCRGPASPTREPCPWGTWRRPPPLLSRSAPPSTVRRTWAACTAHTISTSISVDTLWEWHTPLQSHRSGPLKVSFCRFL